MTNTVATYLKYANVQMAAEADLALFSNQATVESLTYGNNRSSKFPITLANQFSKDWEVVDHKANTSTGFSGTLFKYIGETDPARGLAKGELVMSFRSTEFADDAARDNEATNKLEIQQFGWAFGQIADMQDWYNALLSSNKLSATDRFAVTGYSLGGHLATAFSLLMNEAGKSGNITGVYTFNGAGVGDVKSGTLTEALNVFRANRNGGNLDYFTDSTVRQLYLDIRGLLATPPTRAQLDDSLSKVINAQVAARSFADGAVKTTRLAELDFLYNGLHRASLVFNEAQRVKDGISGGGNSAAAFPVEQSQIDAVGLDYQLAVLRAQQHTAPFRSGIVDGLGAAYAANRASQQIAGLPAMHDIYGAPFPSAVANSQHHYGQSVPVFIEDQPLYRGNVIGQAAWSGLRFGEVKLLVDGFSQNDFGDTHSLVLLVDSLSVQNTLAQLDPTVSLTTLGGIFQAASNLKAESSAGTQGAAEGNVLENVINGLADLLGMGWKDGDRLKGNPDGGTWADINARNAFYAKLQTVQDRAKALQGNVQVTAASTSGQDARNDFATFLSLIYLTPFTLKPVGDGVAALKSLQQALAEQWEADRTLSSNERAQGKGNFSDLYLADRAAMLSWKIKQNRENIADGSTILSPAGKWEFQDKASATTIDIGPVSGMVQRPDHYVVFGGDTADTLTGGADTDHLYGGRGGDTIDAGAGDDYLEGNAGNDSLAGGAGNDTLLGGDGDDTLDSGTGGDMLKGGAGNDTYRFASGDGADTILDSDGQGSIAVNGVTLHGGKAKVVDGQVWTEAGNSGIQYTLIDGANGARDLRITYGDPKKQDSILVKRYTSGALGITLDKAAPVEQPDPVPTHTITPFTYQDGSQKIETRFYFLDDANDIVDPQNKSADAWINVREYYSTDNSPLRRAGGNNLISGTQGNDILQGGTGNSVLNGGGGQDILVAVHGNNRFYATAETDLANAIQQAQSPLRTDQIGSVLAVGNGNNTLVGGAGNDLMMVGTGDNVIVCGSGNDIVGCGVGNWDINEYGRINGKWDDFSWAIVRTGNGVLNVSVPLNTSSAGTIFVQGLGTVAPPDYEGNYFYSDFNPGVHATVGNGNNTIYGGSGSSVFVLSNGDNYVDAGSGNSTIFGGMGNNTIFCGSGNVGVRGGGGNDYIDCESGNDYIVGRGGNNTIFGGTGNDTIFAGNNDDNWEKSETGNNYVEAVSGNNILYGAGGSDTLIGGSGRDTLYAGAGSEYLAAGDGDNLLIGGSGNNTLVGGKGNDTLRAGSGNTTMYGGSGPNQLWGGDGLNVLYAGDGGTIDAPTQVTAGAGNTTIFGGNGYSMLFGGSGSDVIYAGDGGTGNLPAQVIAGSGNTTMFGGAGTASLDGRAAATDVIVGGAGNDTLLGGAGNDTLIAGGGNQYLNGGGGSNTYAFSAGFGNDTLVAGTNATIEFGPGIHAADLTLTAALDQYGSPAIVIRYGEGAITMAGGLNDTGTRFRFNDGGDVLTLNRLMQQANTVAANLPGSNGSVIFSAAAGDALHGGDGNDTIYGWGGNDTLVAGTGHSRIIASGDNDMLVAGSGHSVFVSSGSNSTYSIAQGGFTEIQDTSSSGIATLWLPQEMHLDDFTAVRADNDLVVQSRTGDTSVLLQGFFETPPDGTQWILGEAGSGNAQSLSLWAAQELNASANYEVRVNAAKSSFLAQLYTELNEWGNAGRSLGSGPDIAVGGYYRDPALGYDVPVSRYTFGGVSIVNAPVASADGGFPGTKTWLPSSQSDQAQYVFEERTVPGSRPIYGLKKYPGGSEIIAFPHTDTPLPDSSSRIYLGENSDSATPGYSPQDYYRVTLPDYYQKVVIGYADVMQTVRTNTEIVNRSLTIQIVTGDANDNSIASDGPFVGAVTTGDGNDYVNLGTTSGTLSDWMSADDENDGSHGTEHFLASYIPSVKSFGMGAFIQAGAGNDTLIGTDGNDFLVSGSGSDYLDGGRGWDTYYVSLSGSATDIIYDSGDPGNNAWIPAVYGGEFPLDTLVLPDGVTAQNINWRVFQDAHYQGRNVLELTHGNAKTLIVYSDAADPTQTEAAVGVELFRFSDGTVLTRDQLMAQANHVPDDPVPADDQDTPPSQPQSWKTYNPDGSYAVFTDDGAGNTSRADFDRNGKEIGKSWRHADGSHGDEDSSSSGRIDGASYNADASYRIYTNYDNGSSYFADYDSQGRKLDETWIRSDGSRTEKKFNADGSHSSVNIEANGSSTGEYYNASGQLAAHTWAEADGSHGDYDDHEDGSYSGKDYYANGTYTISEGDALGNAVWIGFNADGRKTADSWWSADGGSGDDVFNADGSSSGTHYHPDGTFSTYADDGRGNINSDDFSADGGKQGDSWTHADGSHGTDHYYSGGSSSGASYGADGRFSQYTNDGHGNRKTDDYAANGIKLSDSWQHADGSSGTDFFLSNGYIHGTADHADGTRSIYSNDGAGHVTTESTDANGHRISVDVYADDGHGNTTLDTYLPDASHTRIWTRSDGSAGTMAFNADRSIAGDSWLSADMRQGVNAGNGHLLMSGESNDVLQGAAGSTLLIGGAGNDSIATGTGSNVIAFDLGDGQDTVDAAFGKNNTLSLGGHFSDTDLVLQKSGNDMVLEIGGHDSVTFKDWYVSPANQHIANLQMIMASMSDFMPGSADAIHNAQVETFDFQKIAGEFDQARMENPVIDRWSITHALLDAHLAGSDTAALGGDLAYEYGARGNLTGMGITAAQAALSDARFGTAAQALHPWPALSSGVAQLK